MRAGVPAGLGRCWAGRLGAGFGLYMTLTAKRQASGRKSSSFRPFSLRALLLPLRMSSRSCWLCLFDLGGQAGSIGAAGGVSIWPGCWACRALLRHGAGLAALSCRVCCPSPLLAVLGQSVRALGLVLGMGGDLRPTGLLISKMHKDSIRNAA